MFTKILKKITIKFLQVVLCIIDKDHRNHEEISMDDVKKFTHVQECNFKSDFGNAKRVFRTVPYDVWELQTTTKTMTAADKHRVIRDDRSCVWLEDLKIGDRILTDNGIEEVISCKSLNIKTHMYCLEVETDNTEDENNHLFYTNGILSHNTTCAVAYLLWKAIFVPDTCILVVANTYNAALEIMDRIRYSYENLPDYIRAGVTEYNKGRISFDNGSKIISRATSPNSTRGLSVSLLYADEFAYAPNPEAFFVSIQPTLSAGGHFVVTSTPKNDEDQFAQIWKGAIDNTDEYGNPINDTGVGKNGFFAYKATWDMHPERDDEWARPIREVLGEARFQQEHCASFVSDDDTLLNPLLLSRMKSKTPIYYTGTMRWYHAPLPNKAYLVALDPSLGTQNDYASIQVFQMDKGNLLQVAEWNHNGTEPRGQVRTLMQTLSYIDYVLRDNDDQLNDPEIYWTFENNSIGEAILQIIEDTGEERFPGILINERKRKGQTRRFRKGMTTTTKNKLSACARLKSLVESDRMIINSANLVKELKNFVAFQNSFRAKTGQHDDLVSASLLVARMLDVVLMWTSSGSELKEYIGEDEIIDGEASDDAMPVLI